MIEWGKRLAQYRQQAGAKSGGSGLTKADFDSSGGEYKIRTDGQWQVVDEEKYLDAKAELEQVEEDTDGTKRKKTPDELTAEAALAEIDSFMKGLNVKAETGVLPDDPSAKAKADADAAAKKKADAKPVEVGLEQFMAAISGQESGGKYDAENGDSGAYGRFQIMPENWPSWSAEAGLAGAAPTPENQDRVAAFKMQQYYNATGSWADVASIWYSGSPLGAYTPEQRTRKQYSGGNEYPSIQEYVDSVIGKLGNYAKNTSEGIPTPSGVNITGGSGSSGSGSTAKYDPMKDYLDSGTYKLETERADEMDRRYDNIASRMKDYGIVASDVNSLLKNIQDAIGNEVALKKANQQIQEGAIKTASEVNAGVKAGKLDYRDALAGPIWSNSLSGLEKELQAIRAAMQTAPEGFADSILRTIPKTVPMEYYVDSELGLPGYSGDYWGQPSQSRYAMGTIPRYAAGTVPFHLEPYLDAYQSGKYVPASIARQLEGIGYGRDGSTSTPAATETTTTTPTAGGIQNSTYRPGYVPKNATLPPDMRVADDGEWLDAAVSAAARNIAAGASAPASWGLGDLSGYKGMPASNFDGGFLQLLRSAIAANADTPEVTQAFGRRPGIETQWVPDPNAPSTKATPGTGGGGYAGTGGLTGAQYGGTYGSGADASEAARLDLEKQQLAIQQGLADASIKLDRERFELEKIQDTRSAEYQAAQIRWNDAKSLLDQRNFDLQVVQQELQKTIFEDSIRRYEIETGMAREKLDLDKIRQQSDMEYQAGQLELARQAGALSQAEYEERKRQFDQTFAFQQAEYDERKRQFEATFGLSQAELEEKKRQFGETLGLSRQEYEERKRQFDADFEEKKRQFGETIGLSKQEYEEKKRQFELQFGYQKEKDKKEQDLQRAKTTVDYMSRPGNAVASNFWYANQPDPVGTKYDLFTGEQTGTGTWQEMYNEDAALYADAMKPVNTYADGSMDGFMHDVAAILGDSKGNRATGHEEVVYNPTGAPLMVLSNEMSRALGFVPNRGKQFGNHVRKGGAA